MTICTDCEHRSPLNPVDFTVGWLGRCQRGHSITWGVHSSPPSGEEPGTRHLMRALENRPTHCECSDFKMAGSIQKQIQVVIRIQPDEGYPTVERVASQGEVHNLTWNDIALALRDGPGGVAPKQWLLRVVGCLTRFEPEASWGVTCLRGFDAWVMSYTQPNLVEAVVPEVLPTTRFERVLLEDA